MLGILPENFLLKLHDSLAEIAVSLFFAISLFKGKAYRKIFIAHKGSCDTDCTTDELSVLLVG